jgi:dTDP-4-amino-4,6-dideoxygalactose transaminase
MTTVTRKLESCVAGLTERNSALAVGRAAWGLYALLSIWKGKNTPQKIALPSFLCQSPLAAVLLAEWVPVFCDIDAETGNVSEAEWIRVVDSGVDAVLFVHLFGNVGNAKYIADICKSREIYFIEDAAQSYGGTWEGRPCGSFGDASIISFGHTKLIDVGHGGMVLASDSRLVNEVRNFRDNCSAYTLEASLKANPFREMFYAARNRLASDPEAAREAFKGLIRIYKPLISTKWNPDVSEELLTRLKHLDLLVKQRAEKNEIYKDLLRDTALVPLNMSPGSVPWRAVFRFPGINWAKQEIISEAVRSEGVDISSWYIPAHWMLEDAVVPDGSLEFTELLSKEVFQLWVDDKTGTDRVKRAASILIMKLNEVGYD